MAGSVTDADLPATGDVSRSLSLSSLDFQANGRAEVTLACTRYRDKNKVRIDRLKVTKSVAVTTTYRAATLTVPTRTVALDGKLSINGRCPYPGSTANAYITDSAGPALQQRIPVATDGRFAAEVDLSKPINAPRPADKPALQPGAGSVSVGCLAGAETSVGSALPITITGTAPAPPPALTAGVRVSPTLAHRGGSVVIAATCPRDTWQVTITLADGAGVFNSTGGPPNGTIFNATLPISVGPNQQATHPATISGSTVTVNLSCNRLPNGGGDILLGATATVQLH
ncbi:hypothetical protein GCM10027579_05260 [Calidifontibacter terrae]